MAFTSKVSNIIRSNLNNLTGGLPGNTGGIFGQAKAAFGQAEKLAAKIANKSPLDISKSPVSHMEKQNNPFKYGQLYYPEETSNLGEGHYIIFDIIMNDQSTWLGATADSNGKISFDTADTFVGERNKQREDRMNALKKQGFLDKNATSVVRNQSSGFAKTSPTHTYLADSIILYTPPSVKFAYKVGYENADTTFFGDFLDAEGFLNTAGALGKRFLETAGKTALEVLIPGFGGAVDKYRGYSQNPNTELAFKNVPFRNFAFPFEFSPKNEDELDTMHKIIQLFKFHMMPEKSGPGYLTSPSEFQITYMYRDIANMYIPKISRCALTDMSVDYSSDDVFTTFKPNPRGAAPVITTMQLQFTEMEIMTKETIADGY
jgi:hypothetical protein